VLNWRIVAASADYAVYFIGSGFNDISLVAKPSIASYKCSSNRNDYAIYDSGFEAGLFEHT
jgi:hypothetical protein